MNKNLKTIVLALAAGLTLIACADEPACAPKTDDPSPVPAAVIDEPTPPEAQVKPRRTRRAKKDKATAPTDGKRKPSRRRTRKMAMSEIPVTGMLDSAE